MHKVLGLLRTASLDSAALSPNEKLFGRRFLFPPLPSLSRGSLPSAGWPVRLSAGVPPAVSKFGGQFGKHHGAFLW